MDVGKDKLLEMYRSMQRIRQFETKVRDLALASEIPGFVHVTRETRYAPCALIESCCPAPTSKNKEIPRLGQSPRLIRA